MSNRREEMSRIFDEHRDYMNDRISAGIENNRKGWFEIAVEDKDGRPVPDAHIRLTQRTHDFRYGANLFMLDEFNEPERCQMYREYFRGAFNLATLPFYWRDLEPEEGKPRFFKDSPKVYRRPAPDLCLEFCKESGIEPKAHCIAYDAWKPAWLENADSDTMRQAYIRRMEQLAARYDGAIPTWEVTNELLFQCNEWSSAMLAEPDYTAWCYETANRFFPKSRLMINDASCNIWNVFNHGHSAYYMQIENLLMKGARIDAIGMQYHMFNRRENEAKETAIYYNPRRLYDVMDYYARLGRPLQITELTIPAYSNDPEDEEIQAELIKNVYSMWFSHEAMEGIIYWNVVDGYAAFAPQGDMTAGENYYYGGLVRYDFTPKPAYRMIQNLFGKVWRTNAEAVTRDNGRVDVKGFYGEYDVEIAANGRTITVPMHLCKTGKRTLRVKIPD